MIQKSRHHDTQDGAKENAKPTVTGVACRDARGDAPTFAWLASLPFATASKAIQYVLKSSGPARNQPRIIEIGGKRCSVEVIDSSEAHGHGLEEVGVVGPTVPDQVLQQMLSNYFASHA